MRLPDGGLWWYCYKHKRGLDSIEILAYYDCISVSEEIDKLVLDPESNLPQEAAHPAFKEEYLAQHEARQLFLKWDKRARNEWLKNRDYINILNSNLGIKIPLLESPTFLSKTLGLWLRFSTNEELEEYLNNNKISGLSKRFLKTFLAIPSYSLPGYPASYFLIGRKKSTLWRPSSSSYGDAGVMLLEGLEPNTERVIAVSSPFLALYLQYLNFLETDRPLPIVVWHEDTNPAIWGQLGVKEVIFWSYEPNPGLFKQALNAAVTSYVSWIPQPNFDVVYDYKSLETLDTWHVVRNHLDRPKPYIKKYLYKDITNRIQQPEVACKNYLLGQSTCDAKHILSILNLTEEQRDAVVATCETNAELNRLHSLFGTSSDLKEVEMFGGIVKQYIGPTRACWTLNKGGREEILSEAVVILDKCFIDEENDDTVYYGKIYYKGQTYNLKTSYKVLKKDPVRAIQFAVEKARGGTPFVSRSHYNKIWDLLFRFSKINDPNHIGSKIDKVGWTKNREKLIFPSFLIERGELKPCQKFNTNSTLCPCAGLDFPELDGDSLIKFLEPTEKNGVLFALLSSLTLQILNRSETTRTSGLGLVGPGAQKCGSFVANELNLLKPKNNEIDLRVILNQSSVHDVPVYIQSVFTKQAFPELLHTHFLTSSDTNLILNLEGYQAYNILLQRPFTIIEDWTEFDTDFVNFYPIFAHSLAYLEAFSEHIRPYHDKFVIITEYLRRWLEKITGRSAQFISEYAKNCIKRRLKVPVAFINMLADIIKQNFGTQSDIFSPINLITINYETRTLKISLIRLNEILQTLNLFIPHYEKVIKALKALDSSVELQEDYLYLRIRLWNMLLKEPGNKIQYVTNKRNNEEVQY